MSNYIIGQPDFRKRLDDWLFKNNQTDADWLFRNRSKIPAMFQSYSNKLYRGMVVDESFLDAVYSNKLTFKDHSSWSKDAKLAEKFASDPKYSIVKDKKTGVKILITKTIPSNLQILDIESFVLFMGEDQLAMLGFDEMSLDSALKEKEVLISKGVKITKSDLKFVK